MNRRRYMLVWSVWGLLIAAALLSACGAHAAILSPATSGSHSK
jgi:hypothetical protein